MKSNKLDWLKDYQRIKRNPVFFIEEYYNRLHPKNEISLTDEERQFIYTQYRTNMIPLLDDKNFEAEKEYLKKIEDLKKQGYRDWEIF
jgi:hypothetical protein